MPNLFKYKFAFDAELPLGDRQKSLSPFAIRSIAFAIVCLIVTTVFSAIVMVLNYCFPGSLDSTYLQLFF